MSASPDWHRSAQSLVSGLLALPEAEQRIELLEAVCHGLGTELYPAFLQLLYVIDQRADGDARRVVSGTLVDCLLSGRLPSVRFAAWGSSGLTGDPAFGQTRVLGPVEFVAVWYVQQGHADSLTREQFIAIMTSMLSLVASDERARHLYAQKLATDIEDPLSGSLASRTRSAIQALVTSWREGTNAIDAVNAFLDALQEQSALHQFARREYDAQG